MVIDGGPELLREAVVAVAVQPGRWLHTRSHTCPLPACLTTHTHAHRHTCLTTTVLSSNTAVCRPLVMLHTFLAGTSTIKIRGIDVQSNSATVSWCCSFPVAVTLDTFKSSSYVSGTAVISLSLYPGIIFSSAANFLWHCVYSLVGNIFRQFFSSCYCLAGTFSFPVSVPWH